MLAVLLVSLPLPSPLAVPPRAQLAVHLLGRRHRCSPPEPGLRRRRLYHLSSSDLATGQHAAHAAPPWLSTTYFRPMAVLQGRTLTCQTLKTANALDDSRSLSVAEQTMQPFAGNTDQCAQSAVRWRPIMLAVAYLALVLSTNLWTTRRSGVWICTRGYLRAASHKGTPRQGSCSRLGVQKNHVRAVPGPLAPAARHASPQSCLLGKSWHSATAHY